MKAKASGAVEAADEVVQVAIVRLLPVRLWKESCHSQIVLK